MSGRGKSTANWQRTKHLNLNFGDLSPRASLEVLVYETLGVHHAARDRAGMQDAGACGPSGRGSDSRRDIGARGRAGQRFKVRTTPYKMSRDRSVMDVVRRRIERGESR